MTSPKLAFVSVVTLSVLVVPAGAFSNGNTCTPEIVGLRQGAHSATNSSADAVLWSPDHTFSPLSISAFNAQGDACDVTIVDATQDEPIDGRGDGNTHPDVANCDNNGLTSLIDVRAERLGPGTGRYYHIEFAMHELAGGDGALGEAKVLVPHSQAIKKVQIDEGGLFNSYDGEALVCAG